MKTFVMMLILGVCGVSAAQDMAPPPEMKAVAFLAGHWSGKETYWFMGQESAGSSDIRSTVALGGRFLHGVHKMKMQGMDMEGMHVMGYDPASKKYQAWWFDSMANGVMEMSGELKGDILTMVAKPTVMPGSTSPVVMRVTWTRKGDKGLSFLLEVQTGDKWEKMIAGDYTKS